MENELNRIQTHLGIWKLEDWSIDICSKQLHTTAVYCIKSIQNDKLLIGEGIIGGQNNRLRTHLAGKSENIQFNNDLKKYGTDNFRLSWIIEEPDENSRKLIENQFQLRYKDWSYNTPRKSYPTQTEIKEYIGVEFHKNKGSIHNRLHNFTINGDCWESNYCKSSDYGAMSFDSKMQKHHILMYIYYNGDICGITSVIHHKCENKRCVNPEHLELVTNTENIHLYHNINKKDIIEKETTSIYLGVNKRSQNLFEGTSDIKIDGIKKRSLGIYDSEIKAAENRDYFIFKNNLLNRGKLNFYNIDYRYYIPHISNRKNINKHLIS
jgi:hypothetical protein